MHTRQVESLSTKILEYIQSRAEDKLESLDKDIVKLKSAAKAEDQSKLEKLEEKRRNEQEKFKPVNWLTDAAKRAKQIQLVTHALKFTHCDAKGSSVFFQEANGADSPKHVIGTSSLANRSIDIVGNAAALDVGGLLMKVNYDDKTLVDSILADDITPLLPIADNEQQAQAWLDGFKQVFVSNELSSHHLAKQIYWPVNDSYHLLSPLFATSFAQNIYDKRKNMRDIQFSKDAEINSDGYSVFPNMAIQTYGGTKPQNISQLNSQRGGKVYLLDARPPTWKSVEKPPLKTISVFKSAYPEKAYKRAKRLQKYLERNFGSYTNVDIRDYRKAGIDDLVEILMLFAAGIHALPAGWSLDDDCSLNLEEKLWLDPGRAEFDEDFRNEMDKSQWQEQVARRFATWLNSTLENKVLAMGEVEHREWTVLVSQELRLTERARKEFY